MKSMTIVQIGDRELLRSDNLWGPTAFDQDGPLALGKNWFSKKEWDGKTRNVGDGGSNKPPPEKTGSGGQDDEPPLNRKVENSNVGDKVRTPETHEADFTKLKGHQGYRNDHTNEFWQRSHTSHKGDAWKVFNRSGQRVGSVKPDGIIVGK